MFETQTRPPSRDYYIILGIPRSATEDDIRKAFRDEARKCHPDTHPGDKAAEERFKEINEAYQVLSDARKKADYDKFSNPPPKPNSGSNVGEAWKNFFGGGQRSEAQTLQENRNRQVAALRQLIGGATSFEQVITNFKNWSMVPGSADAFNENFFSAGPNRAQGVFLPIEAVYKICLAILEDSKHTQTFQDLLDQAAQYNNDPLARHLKTLIAKFKPQTASNASHSRAQTDRPTQTDRPPQTETRPPQPKPEASLNPELIGAAINQLLQKLSGVTSLEEVVIILKSWTTVEASKAFKDSKASAFESFSPQELLNELEKFTSGLYSSLDQSTLLKGLSPVSVGMGNLVREYLKKKTTAKAAPTDTPKPTSPKETPKATPPQPEAPPPLDSEATASAEIKNLRSKILAAKTLTDALAAFTTQLPSELVCSKPLVMPSQLKLTLQMVVDKKIDYKTADFFKKAQAEGAGASPVAKHLLKLAETGKL